MKGVQKGGHKPITFLKCLVSLGMKVLTYENSGFLKSEGKEMEIRS